MLALLVAPFCAAAFAAESSPVELGGRAGKGPCSKADLFVSEEGKRYEVDRSRSQLQHGISLHIEGRVYPRISVCKQFPWLEVIRVGESKAVAPVAPVAAREPKRIPTLPDSVTITIAPQELASLVPVIGVLSHRPDVKRVRLLVHEEGDFSRFSAVMGRLGMEAHDVMRKVSIEIGAYKTPTFSRETSGQVYTYRSWEEMKYALSIR